MNPGRDRDEAIIEPRRGKGDPELDPDAVMVMIPSMLGDLVRDCHAAEIPFSDSALYHLYRSARSRECTIHLAGPFVGAPHAVIGMEKLIAMGATRVWALGWCGSLQPWMTGGQIILPDSAVSEEGTSGHYPVADTPGPDEGLVRALEQALEQIGLAHTKGPVWTTDAPYRETPDKVTLYQHRGVLAVEMEMSALMTLATYRGVSMAGLLIVSDELFDLKWKPCFSKPLLRNNSREATRAVLEAITRVSRKTE
jgi:uridine phosphorylase